MIQQAIFILHREDIFSILLHDARAKALSKGRFMRLFFLWLLSILLIVCGAIILDGQNFWHYWSYSLFKIALLYGGIIFAMLLFNYYIILPRYVRGRVLKDNRVGLEYTILWDEKAIAISDSSMKGTYPFRLFKNWRESEYGFILYIKDEQFNFVPKSALSDIQIENLRKILSTEIKPVTAL